MSYLMNMMTAAHRHMQLKESEMFCHHFSGSKALWIREGERLVKIYKRTAWQHFFASQWHLDEPGPYVSKHDFLPNVCSHHRHRLNWETSTVGYGRHTALYCAEIYVILKLLFWVWVFFVSTSYMFVKSLATNDRCLTHSLC